MWKQLYGCAADPDRPAWSDPHTSCTSLCAAPQQLELCAMLGLGHTLNLPNQMGYALTIAW